MILASSKRAVKVITGKKVIYWTEVRLREQDMIEEGSNLQHDLLVIRMTSAQANQMPKENPAVPTIRRCSSASLQPSLLTASLRLAVLLAMWRLGGRNQNILRS